MDSLSQLVLLPLTQFNQSTNRFYWLYFIPFLLILLVLFLVRKRGHYSLTEAREFLINGPINRQSIWLDVRFFFINSIVFYLMARASGQIAAQLSSVVFDGAVLPFLSGSHHYFNNGIQSRVLGTCLIFIAMDFGVFLMHFSFHKVSILWAIHRVHHSAETLTPFTMFRFHPIEDGLTIFSGAFFSFLMLNLLRYLIDGFSSYTYSGLNILLVVFYFSGFQLRHTQIWLAWPKPFSYIFISPAQHQIHHSSYSKHQDKNFGLCLSIWDRLFNSHYAVSAKPEPIRIGLTEQKQAFQSIRDCYFEPLGKIAARSTLLCIGFCVLFVYFLAYGLHQFL